MLTVRAAPAVRAVARLVALAGPALIACLAPSGLTGCHRKPASPPRAGTTPPVATPVRDRHPAAPGTKDERAAEALLANVVDPWTWPRAAGASDREMAIEDIGPYERPAMGDRTAPNEHWVNTNAEYWTNLVGIAWTRDVSLDLDHEPVDLDGDGRADTHATRHVHARGGVLANPALFGLIATPDDPRGRPGRISISTGVLGLREAMNPDGTPSGQIGMTCFVCHGGVDPETGRIVLGQPGVAFDYGLLLATAAVLDDERAGPSGASAAAYRRAHGYPDGRTVRARLLLAGPGRQDLTGEFGLDVTIPGMHSPRYAGTVRVRQGTKGLVNPISVPGVLAASGMDAQNWSASEWAGPRALARLFALGSAIPGDGRLPTNGAAVAPGTRAQRAALLAALGLPDPDGHAATGDLMSAVQTRRALMLDLRNLGTLGLQDDSFPGLLWADAINGHETLSREAIERVPPMYAAAAVRRVLAEESASWKAAPGLDAAAVARGRVIFLDKPVGWIANQQIWKEAPSRAAAAKLSGPILAPIDEALPPRFAVRCADCHNATPGGPMVSLADHPPPLGRCDHCHRAHEPFEPDDRSTARQPLRALDVPTDARAQVALCTGCHERHRAFGPLVYSNSLILPFDADGDGRAQDDETDDERAGGIGTEAWLAFDVPRPEQPPQGFGLDLPAVERAHAGAALGRVTTRHTGVTWVRVAPLIGIRGSAPYLHNGSVPNLRALFEPPARRPPRFALGRAGFVFDARLPGNRSLGHAFGTHLSAGEKNDLVQFLRSL